ncbi:MAG: hypothetical protein WC155_07230 [Candidatus Cloacimonadales bacterium]
MNKAVKLFRTGHEEKEFYPLITLISQRRKIKKRISLFRIS